MMTRKDFFRVALAVLTLVVFGVVILHPELKAKLLSFAALVLLARINLYNLYSVKEEYHGLELESFKK